MMYQQTIRPTRKQHRRDEDGTRRLAGRMVLCVGELANAAVIERYFQERGWRVHLAESGIQARQLVREQRASVALLAEEATDQESGWLTCWKLLHESPKTRVVVLGSSHAERGARRAEIVGAERYLHESESAATVYRALMA